MRIVIGTEEAIREFEASHPTLEGGYLTASTHTQLESARIACRRDEKRPEVMLLPGWSRTNLATETMLFSLLGLDMGN